jgi:hypothetical protein
VLALWHKEDCQQQHARCVLQSMLLWQDGVVHELHDAALPIRTYLD